MNASRFLTGALTLAETFGIGGKSTKKYSFVCLCARSRCIFKARKNVTIYYENIDRFFVSDLHNTFV